MNILFTGASSFTGYWFVTKLAEAGHQVRTTFTRDSAEAYGDDVRGQRVRRVAERSKPLFSCPFGSAPFLEYLKNERVDLLCHHAADVTDYKSPAFDICSAVANNTRGVQEVLKLLSRNSKAALLLTGSVFEGGEGAGSEGLPAFSPYGVSKAATADICAYYCRAAGVPLGKFVIPNPFGPWEDARFTGYLMRAWSNGDVANIRTPAYVRDNIHASLLALAYVAFAEALPATNDGFRRTNPSGYVESQGAFAGRLAQEMRLRTGWECRFECARQTEFDEPRIRINTDPVNGVALGWDEAVAWNKLAQWYTP